MPLPGDSWNERNGLKLGVNDVTKRGMKEKEMKEVAEFISRALMKENPHRIGSEVAKYMKSYQQVRYCFD